MKTKFEVKVMAGIAYKQERLWARLRRTGLETSQRVSLNGRTCSTQNRNSLARIR